MTDSAPESPSSREAPRELLAFALAVRPDWTEDETWAAMHAARTAGLAWDRLALRLITIALREEEPPTRPRELWDHARGITAKTASGTPDGHVAGAVAALIAGDYDAAYMATHGGAVRTTGPQPRLTEENDTRESA